MAIEILLKKKVRIIVLNTCDYMNISGGNGMSYEQKDFLMRALDLSEKTDYALWTTIILSHIPLDFLGGDYAKGSDLKAILSAYDSGGIVSISVNNTYAHAEKETPSNYATYQSGSLVYNYAGKNAPKVINIHGHVHTNCYGKLKYIDTNTELNIARVATANSGFQVNKTNSYTDRGEYSISTTEGNKIKKQANSAKDTSATFYVVDLAEQVIYSVGYGADIDRTIPYSSATVYTVTNNLVNFTTNNNAVSVLEGNPYSATLSVGSDYTINTITVTMGGVNVTSSVVNGQTISIPSVTGNIVINATATESPFYQQLTDFDVCIRSDFNRSTVSLSDNNSSLVLLSNIPNDFGWTNRSNRQAYAMPKPTRATKCNIECTDTSVLSTTCRAIFMTNNGGTLTVVSSADFTEGVDFNIPECDYMAFRLLRTDSYGKWDWGYSPSNFTIVFKN